METVMKKLILAATFLAPLAIAAPAFAQGIGDAAGFIETPAVTTYAPNNLPREFTSGMLREFQAPRAVQAPREFQARNHRMAPTWNRAAPAPALNGFDRSLIDREVVPSSAFTTTN
jgi:hypothetical protein